MTAVLTRSEDDTLPGTPGKALSALYDALGAGERDAFKAHLLGGTSAEWLAQVMSRHGHSIGATTIKAYRRRLVEDGVQL